MPDAARPPLRLGGWCGVLLLFAAATVALTWPLACSGDRAPALRDDYFSNLWNAWWVQQVLAAPDLALYWTDHLHHPLGVSLARHTLSLANAAPIGLLTGALGAHGAFSAVLLAHFWLSGFVFFLFARELTGSLRGSLLAGLVWSFSPFHFHYLPEINLAALELLPLAGLFLVRSYRGGAVTDAVGAALAAALLALASSYYLVYAALLGGLLLAGGPLWAPEVPWRRGALRLLGSAAGCSAAVLVVAWPILSEPLPGGGLSDSDVTALREHALRRSNDLLGFLWIGGPERVILAWPVFFGYSALALAALGVRARRPQLFWLGGVVLFLVLGFGPRLQLAGSPTPLPLPAAWIPDLPLLWMLRKPDRFALLALLSLCVLVAWGWRALAARLPDDRARWIAWGVAAALVCAERSAAPLETFDLEPSPLLEKLAGLPGDALVDLPYAGADPPAGRSNFYQTRHAKRTPGGYVTNLALTPEHWRLDRAWRAAQKRLRKGDAGGVRELAVQQELAWVVLHKTVLGTRRPIELDGQVVWTPFAGVARELVGIRQRGHLEALPLPPALLATERQALVEAFGPPQLEDEAMVLFATRAEDAP